MAGKAKVKAHKRKGKSVMAHTRKTKSTKMTGKSGNELDGKKEAAKDNTGTKLRGAEKQKMGPNVKG